MGDEKDKELTHEEQLAQLRQVFEQAKEGMKEMAGMMAAYYRALKEEGFTEEEAFALVMGYQQQMIANFSNGD